MAGTDHSWPSQAAGFIVARRVPSGEHPVHADDQSVRIIGQAEEGRRGLARRREAEHPNPVVRPAKMLGPSLDPGIEMGTSVPVSGSRAEVRSDLKRLHSGQLSQRLLSALSPPFATGMMCSISNLAMTRRWGLRQ